MSYVVDMACANCGATTIDLYDVELVVGGIELLCGDCLLPDRNATNNGASPNTAGRGVSSPRESETQPSSACAGTTSETGPVRIRATHLGRVDQALIDQANTSRSPHAFWSGRLAFLGYEVTRPEIGAAELDETVAMLADTAVTFDEWQRRRGESA